MLQEISELLRDFSLKLLCQNERKHLYLCSTSLKIKYKLFKLKSPILAYGGAKGPLQQLNDLK
jgi:hypothetical protein